MDATRPFIPYRIDVSETVLEQIRLLYAQERRISELEIELEKIRTDHASLKRDLEPYLIGPSQEPALLLTEQQMVDQVPLPPIHQCPNEILHLIFDQYLSICGHLFIRRLLLVCRRWSKIVSKSAKLWARIEVCGANYLYNLFPGKSIFPYISACISRSDNLPLDIYLDFRELDGESFIIDQLYTLAKLITNEDDHEHMYDTITSQTWSAESGLFDAQVEKAFNQLFDEDHVQRWRSLAIYFPANERASDVWNRLKGLLHGLNSLTIYYFPLMQDSEEDVGRLPSISSLKHLDLRRDVYNITQEIFPDISPDILEHLEIDVGWIPDNLAGLSHFTQLRILSIDCQGSIINRPREAIHSIHLPVLESLIFHGYYGKLRQHQFELPSLDLLIIKGQDHHAKLKGLSPRRIRWSIESWAKRKLEVSPIIQDFILLSDSLHTFIVQDSERNVAEDVIAQCKARGEASALTQLVIENSNGVEIERINV